MITSIETDAPVRWAQVSSLQSRLASFEVAAKEATEQLRQAGAAGLEAIAGAGGVFGANAERAAAAAAEKLTEAHRKLAAGLEAERAELESMVEAQRAASNATSAATQAIVERARSHLEATQVSGSDIARHMSATCVQTTLKTLNLMHGDIRDGVGLWRSRASHATQETAMSGSQGPPLSFGINCQATVSDAVGGFSLLISAQVTDCWSCLAGCVGGHLGQRHDAVGCAGGGGAAV